MGGAGEATVLGARFSAPAAKAALANGVSGHAMDYDDTQLSTSKEAVYGLLTHPTTPVLSAVLALGERERISGKDMLLAYILGVEVECRIADAINPRHYQEGFHSTATIGGLGAAMAIGKILRLREEPLLRTLGIAASMASGLRENFGTMTKPLHAGRAAENGVTAAELAARGFTSAVNIIEARRGLFNAMAGGGDASKIAGRLGNPYFMVDPGISIKPYPSGSLTHPGMTELERLIHAERITAADVLQLEVGTNSQMPRALHYHLPQRGLEGKFSMEYCLAVLLVAGKAGLNEFTDAVVVRPDLQAMMGRIRFYVDPEAEAAGYSKMTTLLKIHLRGGRVISSRADFAKGSPALPMSFDDVAEKFRGCAAYAQWPEDKTAQIIAGVGHLEDLPDIGALTTLAAA